MKDMRPIIISLKWFLKIRQFAKSIKPDKKAIITETNLKEI
jgi:hypothetical protein